MRAFVAIPLPEPVRETLVAVQAILPAGRRLRPDTLHLTLAFLGDIRDAEAWSVDDALSGIRMSGFPVTLRGFGTFGGAQPRVICAAVAPSQPLETLHRRVRSRLHDAGLMLPRERFVPHVTLARLGHTPAEADIARLARFMAAEGDGVLDTFTADSFALFRSRLGPGGAVHEELASYALEDGPEGDDARDG